MVSDERKRQAEAAGRQEMKRFWGDVLQDNLAAAIADIRVQVVEKGWYGTPLYDYGSEMHRGAEFYGRADLEARAQTQREPEKERERSSEHGTLER